MDFTRESKMCSFCGKQGSSDLRLAGGLGAQVCAECIEHFHGILQSPERLAEASRPPWERMEPAELVATLPLIAASAEQNVNFMREWVDMLRERGVSWAEIGRALGVSRQAAWERFSQRRPNRNGSTA